MPRNTKLSTYVSSTGSVSPSAAKSVPCGTFSSSTITVMRMAMTPSLKASSRPLLIRIPSVCRRFGSVHAEIARHLPGRDVLDVVQPLLPLGGDVVIEQVIAEHLAHEAVLFQLVQRLVEISGQLVDAKMPPLPMAHGEDVLVHR